MDNPWKFAEQLDAVAQKIQETMGDCGPHA